jgi:diguanylate cyclase (GGDEF)-like protein
MAKRKQNKSFLIIGGGRRSLAAIEILHENDEYGVAGVADINPNSSGIKLAQRLGIKTSADWRQLLKTVKKPFAILNLTDDKSLQSSLEKESEKLGFEVPQKQIAGFIDSLLIERQVQAELHRVSKKITTDIGMDELMVLILSTCIKSTKAHGGLIILKDEPDGQWQVKSDWEIEGKDCSLLLENVKEIVRRWPEDKPIIYLNEQSEEGEAVLENSMCAPLRFRDEIIGVIVIVKKDPKDRFSVSSERLLSNFAIQAAVAVENLILYRKSQHLSITDGLTGLYNHRYFQEQLCIELSRAQRYDLNFSIVIVDVDNFKDINDTYGHIAGDEILRRLAAYIKKTTRESDIVARYGGDEFVMLLPETPKDGAAALCNRIRAALAQNIIGGNIPVKISMGISAYPDDGVYNQDIVEKADSALYRAKEEGRDRICTA